MNSEYTDWEDEYEYSKPYDEDEEEEITNDGDDW
jgi:hypothetical protein